MKREFFCAQDFKQYSLYTFVLYLRIRYRDETVNDPGGYNRCSENHKKHIL